MKTKLTLIMLIAGFLCAQSQTWTWSEELPQLCPVRFFQLQ